MQRSTALKTTILCIFSSMVLCSCRDFPHTNPYDPKSPTGDAHLGLSRYEITWGEVENGMVGPSEPFELRVYLRNNGTTTARDVEVMFGGLNVIYYISSGWIESGSMGYFQPFVNIIPSAEGTTIPDLLISPTSGSVHCGGQSPPTAKIAVYAKWNDQPNSVLMDTIRIPVSNVSQFKLPP